MPSRARPPRFRTKHRPRKRPAKADPFPKGQGKRAVRSDPGGPFLMPARGAVRSRRSGREDASADHRSEGHESENHRQQLVHRSITITTRNRVEVGAGARLTGYQRRSVVFYRPVEAGAGQGAATQAPASASSGIRARKTGSMLFIVRSLSIASPKDTRARGKWFHGGERICFCGVTDPKRGEASGTPPSPGKYGRERLTADAGLCPSPPPEQFLDVAVRGLIAD